MTETWKQWEGHLLNGQFTLQRYLGGSDHSAVFLTQRPGEPQRAIKFVSADPADRERQLLRWKAASAVTDANLIRMFETGRCLLGDSELLYVVMEYAEEDLSQILPQRSLLTAEAQEMLKPVVHALAQVHDAGFVHGGVKPSNIMAVGEQVKLSTDTLRARGETTLRGDAKDFYAAPETARGEWSTASDVWALGTTVVEALTQRHPTWDRMRPGSPTLPEGLPEPFREIARNCLQVDPKQRWTAAQIVARLEGKQVRIPKQAVPEATAESAQHSHKGTSAKRLYLLGLAALIVVAIIAVTRSSKNPPSTESPTPKTPAQQESPAATSTTRETPRKQKPSPGKGGKAPSLSETGEAHTADAASPPEKTPDSSLPAGVVHEVLPQVPAQARETISGKVRVRVKVDVDTSGNVVSASFDSQGPSKYFARLAMEAAQGWKFSPAQVEGRPVASQWVLRFGFTRHDTEVVPVRTAP